MLSFNATLVVVLISFVIFMLAMKAIYFDPIMRIKHERERRLTEDRNSAQRFAEEFERIHAEYEAGLKKARKEAHQVIQAVRQRAKAEAQQALVAARGQAQTEMDRQMTELQNWRETTYRQLEGEREALTRVIIGKVTAGNKIHSVSGG